MSTVTVIWHMIERKHFHSDVHNAVRPLCFQYDILTQNFWLFFIQSFCLNESQFVEEKSNSFFIALIKSIQILPLFFLLPCLFISWMLFFSHSVFSSALHIFENWFKMKVNKMKQKSNPFIRWNVLETLWMPALNLLLSSIGFILAPIQYIINGCFQRTIQTYWIPLKYFILLMVYAKC